MAASDKQQLLAEMLSVRRDLSEAVGLPCKFGDLVTIFTATRAFRGVVAEVWREWIILTGPTFLVWQADSGSTGRSDYFTPSRAPRADIEEPTGARMVAVSLAGMVYLAHHAEAPVADITPIPQGLFVQDALGDPKPALGQQVWCCTVTHEWVGVPVQATGTFVRLQEARVVNDVATHAFADVLRGTGSAEDELSVSAEMVVALYACTALLWA